MNYQQKCVLSNIEMVIDMDNVRRVLFPGVLEIISNTTKIHYFSFAEDFSDKFFDKRGNLKIEFYIKPQKYFERLEEIRKKEFLFYYSDEIKVYSIGNNMALFQKKRILPIGNLYANCLLQLDNIVLEVSKFYYNCFRFKIENLLPPGIVLKDLTYLLLVLNNYLPVHSSSFAIDEEEAFLVLAPPNVGKSYVVMQAVEDGFLFLSEDISIIDENGKIYPVVYTSTYVHEVSKLKYLSLLSYYLPKKIEPMGKKYRNKLLSISTVKKIFILEPAREKNIKFLKRDFIYLSQRENIIAKMLTLNKDEFRIFDNKFISAYFYLTSSIFQFSNLELNLMNNLVDSAEDVILIQSNTPEYFYQAIKSVL